MSIGIINNRCKCGTEDINPPTPEVKPIAVYFIDHRGIVEIQYYDRFESVSNYPTPKEYTDITFVEWTHELSELSNLQHDMVVGATYRSADGSIILNIALTAVTGFSVTLNLILLGSSMHRIDWGDGTFDDITTSGSISHTYSTLGKHKIKIIRINGSGILQDVKMVSDTQSLIDVVLTDTVVQISTTFQNCTNLESIAIPNSVLTIATSAFNGCRKMAYAVIPKSALNLIAGSAFLGCSNLRLIAIPNTATELGSSNMFNGCSNLKLVIIPNKITNISLNTFVSCLNFTSVVIPKSITSIGAGAFQSCFLLTDYVFLGTTVPTIQSDTFAGINRLTKIYVPDSVATDYKNATNWNLYANYVYPLSQRKK
jgi:hypothetical protein